MEHPMNLLLRTSHKLQVEESYTKSYSLLLTLAFMLGKQKCLDKRYNKMRRTNFYYLYVLITSFYSTCTNFIIFCMRVFGFNNALTGEVSNTIVSADPNPQMKEVTVEPMV